MITNEQVEAALKAWYDAGDAGNFASMFAALKAAELTSCARIAELEAALKPFAVKDTEVTPERRYYDMLVKHEDRVRARDALEKKND